MNFDLAAFKAEFPILARPGGGGAPLHYLDNAATAQCPERVIEAVARHERENRGNIQRGTHHLAERALEAYENARAACGRYLNAPAEEIVFTGGATAALNLIAHGLGEGLKAGDEVLLSVAEHHSALLPWQEVRRRKGIELRFLPVTRDGRLDLSRLADLVGPRTKVIALTHASNVTGAVSELAPVIEAASAFGAILVLDGAQRAPHGPLDLQALGCDFYALAGHKCFGPNGVGVLWGRRALLERLPPLLVGGGMVGHVELQHSTFGPPVRRFEAGTPPIAQAVGLGAALDWLGALPWPAIHAHLADLSRRLLDGLAAFNDLRLCGPRDLANRLPVFAFDLAGAHPHDVCQILDRSGVALRGGHHCAQPLMAAFGVEALSRASLAPYNDQADIDALLKGLDQARRILL